MSSDVGTFGDLLRQYRVRAGFSQEQLAEKARISVAAIGALERGIRRAPYPNTISLLAKALDLSVSETAALQTARHAGRRDSARKPVTHNLPSHRTSLVGRDADVEQIVKLLGRSRLVTVTGFGGVGKSRAAIEAAQRTLGHAWHEIWFVDLSPLRDGNSIPAKIASTIRPPLIDRAESLAALASGLASRHMLLILDNCEHVIAEAALASNTILENCPDLTILTTSRERLNVAGEFVYRLPALAPEPATQLLTQRAEAADPTIAFDAKSLPLVAYVARRLEGIPLAIELAAAHVPLVGIETVLEHLPEELRTPSGRRDLPARQQTVIATIAWSYDLLTTMERTLLCDIAIFAGGFSLAAAETVCTHEELQSTSVLAALSALANKSLLGSQKAGEFMRYSLLESVRSFALEQLCDAGRFEATARRHAQWLAALSDEVEDTAGYLSSERATVLSADFDNVRAAITWALGSAEPGDRGLAARILTGLSGLWDHAGLRFEHRRSIEAALQLMDEARDPLAVSYLLRALSMRASQEPASLALLHRAVMLGERAGDDFALAKVLIVAAQIQAWHGNVDEAERSLGRALPLLVASRKVDSMLYVGLLFARSQVHMQQRRIDEARADIAAAEAKALELGDRYYVICYIYTRRFEIEYAAGNKQLALEFLERMMESEFASDPQTTVFALGRIANLRLQLGDVDGAIERLQKWLCKMRGNEGFTHGELELAALALALRGHAFAAARLLGRVRSIEQRLPFQRGQARQDAYDLLTTLLRQQLSDDVLEKAIDSGMLLAPGEAVDEALTALAAFDSSVPVSSES
ncbi:MAG: helix-turn-helix domain-containing protein [Candidatus Eremiobacteraeota bacterium]|nr:helix-turn-helix domain-containing protein [Candidatus Eremiobacteraeota bacterium]MBV8459342.1 helix-turn-helix domain-containing protein [Candidatus Eremiobacteraeota bacterium]